MKMKKKQLFMMLGMAAMLASCSQDELGGAQSGGTATITATVDNGISTRASTFDTDDVKIDRCLLEVYGPDGNIVGSQVAGTPGADGTTFTFTVGGLDPDVQYDYLFWADNEEAAAYGGSLKERALADGADLTQALAFQGKIEDATPANATDVTLKHAVAKVTLKTTGAMGTGDKVTLNIPDVADTWNVLDGTAAGSATETYAYTLTSAIAQPQDAAEVTTFYVPAPVLGTTSDMTLNYANASGSKSGSTTVTNVPLKADYRTVLKGDVAALFGGATANITAQLTEAWSTPDSETVFTETNVITTTGVGQITEEAVRKALEIGEGTVIVKGQISEADLTVIAAVKDVEMNLDLSQATLMNNDGTAAVATFPDSFYLNLLATVEQNKLKSIILPQGIETLSDKCFYNNRSLTSVTLPEGLKTIGGYAFYNTALTSINFPESLEVIGEYAFNSTDLESVTISENVTAVGERCFEWSGLKNVVWNSSCDITDDVFSRIETLETVTLNKCGTIAQSAFRRSDIQEMTVNIATPPTFTIDPEPVNKPGIDKIYVPAESVETYKTTADWSEYADVITAIQLHIAIY